MHPQSSCWCGAAVCGAPRSRGALLAALADGPGLSEPCFPVLGMAPPITETKAAHGVLSADRSPSSDEMHDPVPTHMASEESNYILETVAGTRNEASGRLRGGTGVRACVRN